MYVCIGINFSGTHLILHVISVGFIPSNGPIKETTYVRYLFFFASIKFEL